MGESNPNPVTEATVTETKKSSNPAAAPAVTRHLPAVLAGAETLTNGQLRIGLELRVKSGSGMSALRVADVKGVTKGEPVYITKPIVLEGKNLKKFLVKKGILTKVKPNDPEDMTVNEPYGKLIEDAEVSCDAFYFTTQDNPLLMMFQLKFEQGLIKSLVGDDDIAELFDVKGVSVRLLRCKKEDFHTLQAYAAQLAED
ncbi:MAG: hypothetical protein IT391_15245 [Nitrospira sp.]|nr:hypothetical protein [Nitrospira sp.]